MKRGGAALKKPSRFAPAEGWWLEAGGSRGRYGEELKEPLGFLLVEFGMLVVAG